MSILNFSFNRVPKDHGLFSNGDASGKAALAFVHIPKTAGTWFTRFLAQHFSQEEIAPPDYGTPGAMGFSDPSRRLFAGHFRWQDIDTTRPIRLVTFLRDPVQRSASQYRTWHHKANFNETWQASVTREVAEAVQLAQRSSYEEFVLSDNPIFQSCIRDIQTSYLSSHPDRSHPDFLGSAIENLEKKFFFVGIQEFSGESLQLFSYQTGSMLKPASPTLNVSQPYDVTLSTAARERLHELLQNDLVLYQAARRLFEKRMAAISKGLKAA